MSNGPSAFDKLKLVSEMQQSEASIHWRRNNIFLTCSSILLLAISQFTMKFIQITIVSLGFVLNFAWLLIQYRSSEYILHWSAQARLLTEQVGGTPDLFPEGLKGIPMREVAFIFPIAFMAIWVILGIALL